ncbi:MAG: hypothetical protein CL477_09945 [Acidobacteria bacterium]|jgi:hypothetical protein|nr:hypothetical protein [Acidobacteriota bacterium]HJN43734.1 hypothetical protein [Vicinamibacterales bacterium]|tara:strand:- start:259 stop:732 length:474 start_codon:yes stop_codon:yes gene_type:complete
MSAALITASILSLVGLVVSVARGYMVGTSDDVLQHATLAIFVTFVTLLAHSMTMFYLIGKGRAIRDAVTEGGLTTDAEARVSALRGPVFTLATMAMALTMGTAIFGGGVDIGVVPSGFHAILGVLAVAANGVALRAIVNAFGESSRIVDEVNRALGV